jgi:hypothetical protein
MLASEPLVEHLGVVDPRHDQEQPTVDVFAVVGQIDDARVSDGGGAAGLVEAVARVRLRELATQPHQRDAAIHRRVVRLVDLPETTVASICDHPIAMRHRRVGFQLVTGRVPHRVRGNHPSTSASA